MNKKIKRAINLIPLALILIIGCTYTYLTRYTEKTAYFDEQISSYDKMQKLTKAVKKYKIDEGLAIYEYDYFDTGLLGDEYNIYTTTLGDLGAKRTTTNPDMAAMVVRIFKEIGLKEGDHVAVGFSGSFPGLNLAILSAGEVMNLDFTIISSFGSSTYGANQPSLSFPEILHRLKKDGYTSYESAMVTLGGAGDVLDDKDKNIVEKIVNHYEKIGLNLVMEEDLNKNIEEKIKLYEQKYVDAYIAVGGNVSFFGKNGTNYIDNQGILKDSKNMIRPYSYEDGIISYFLSKDVPTVHMLNIKKLVGDYGIDFDPIYWEESEVYYKVRYKKSAILLMIVASFAYLIFVNKDKYKNETDDYK